METRRKMNLKRGAIAFKIKRFFYNQVPVDCIDLKTTVKLTDSFQPTLDTRPTAPPSTMAPLQKREGVSEYPNQEWIPVQFR